MHAIDCAYGVSATSRAFTVCWNYAPGEEKKKKRGIPLPYVRAYTHTYVVQDTLLFMLILSPPPPPPAPRSPAPQPVAGFPPLPILLTNTLVPKDTRALVTGVRRLLEAHVSATTAIFQAIGAIATEFLERAAASVAGADPPSKDGGKAGGMPAGGKTAALTAGCVGELAEMNHRLLCALGVGHPALERVCAVAGARGCRSKLTGAGALFLFVFFFAWLGLAAVDPATD